MQQRMKKFFFLSLLLVLDSVTSQNRHHHHHHEASQTQNHHDGKTGAEPSEPAETFCNGMSMIMAMSGFQWSLVRQGDCLTYFAPAWKLNTTGKFHGAMFYTFLLALLTEGLTALQLEIRKQLQGRRRLRKIILAAAYALNQWMGYILMLVTMMYSLELFACVILGVMTGRTLFARRKGRGGRAVPRVTTTLPSESPLPAQQPLIANSTEASTTVRRRRQSSQTSS